MNKKTIISIMLALVTMTGQAQITLKGSIVTKGSDHLTEKYGEKGTLSREEFEAKAKAWYFAELLRDERKRQKLTQQQLGERIGKKREYISSLEQGQTDMQLSTFMLIANALGLRFSLVIG